MLEISRSKNNKYFLIIFFEFDVIQHYLDQCTINQPSFQDFLLIVVCLRMFSILLDPRGTLLPEVHYLIASTMIFRKSKYSKHRRGYVLAYLEIQNEFRM